MRIKTEIRRFLERQLNKQYHRNLKKCRKEIDYETFRKSAVEESFSINPSHKAARELCFFVRKNGSVAENALDKLVSLFDQNPDCLIAYGDEDIRGTEPIFRAAFGPHNYFSGDSLGSVIAIDASLDASLPKTVEFVYEEEIRTTLTGLLHKADAFGNNHGTVVHLPQILFSTDGTLEKKQIVSVKPIQPPVHMTQRRKGNRLSVIIPSKDQPEVLKRCLYSLKKTPFEAPMEILVVDNGSCEENKQIVEELLKDIQDGERIITGYLYQPMPFNFSRMCNIGAKKAKGDVLLFLNDDIEATESDWLIRMWQQVSMAYTGAVGCKLYYPGSIRVQHLGVTNLPGGPVHKYQYLEEKEEFFYQEMHNVLAVTGACLMLRKDLFWQAGGFAEKLTVAYNDVALCMSLYRLGYYNVVLTKAVLYHHESLSRGSDVTREKLIRLKEERDTLYEMFPEYRNFDPFYPQWFSHELGDTTMRPRFFRVKQRKQKSVIEKLNRKQEFPAGELDISLDLKSGKGYGVVPFENNALYYRYLTFHQKDSGEYYLLKLTDQYCEETSFWKQEQPNCALCGFDVSCVKAFPDPKRYEIGYLVKPKLGGNPIHKNFESKHLGTEI